MSFSEKTNEIDEKTNSFEYKQNICLTIEKK